MRRPQRETARRRSRVLVWPALAGLAATLTWSAPAGADGDRSGLPEAVETILGDARMEGGAASVVIADATSGDVLYEHRPTGRLMPASNTKLTTSAAALELLGPGYRFTTDALADGRRSGSVLHGDLYLRGTGDPTMLAADYDRLAADVAAAGVKRVTGRLVADDTRFDTQRLGSSWAADDESAYYSAQISPLNVAPDTDYDTGSVVVEVTPGAKPGERPKVKVTPDTDYVDVEVRATTAAADATGTLSVAREHGGNTVTVGGVVPAGGDTTKEWVSVWEPTGYAAAVFRDALAAHGVRVGGGDRSGQAVPKSAERLAAHRSMPLKDLLVPFMKLSNNMHAEVLTKTIGHETKGSGTWSAGLEGISRYLEGAGVDPGRLRQVDGSGLSRMNAFPARQLAELLLSARGEPWYDAWYASLPVACDPDRFTGGTLRSRMCGTPAAGNARGKTGSLTGASALSGYVTDAGGRELVYSIVLNNYLASSVKSVEDAVVVTLASSDEKRTTLVQPRAKRAAEPDTALECSWLKPRRC